MKRVRIALAVAVWFFSLVLGTSLDAALAETLTLIDVPGASGAIGTQANGINPQGDIVGVYVTNGLNTHGFLLSHGTFTTIDAPGALFPPPPTSGGTSATGINARGDIVGFFGDSSGIHGFLLRNGTFATIDAPGSNFTVPLGINARGEIVGSYFDSSSRERGFLLSGGEFSTISVPGTDVTVASAINPRGDIVGFTFESGFAIQHGFLLSTEGTLTTVDVPGGTPGSTQALGINPRGDIVGFFGASNGFLWPWLLSNGAFSAPIIEAFRAPECECSAIPSGIGPRGDIVGSYSDFEGVHGFLLSKE